MSNNVRVGSVGTVSVSDDNFVVPDSRRPRIPIFNIVSRHSKGFQSYQYTRVIRNITYFHRRELN